MQKNENTLFTISLALFTLSVLLLLSGCVPDSGTSSTGGGSPTADTAATNAWETANPIVDLPSSPLGIQGQLSQLTSAPTPQSVRLGRWLFFDNRLSADNTISCASCHQSAAALSNTTAVSIGIDGQHGTRKAPPLLNLAFAAKLFFFWDGRAASLEAQASGPIENPIEMGNTEAALVAMLQANPSYPQYFQEAFQTSAITMPLITKAIADYERTRMSGNSPFDQWRAGQNNAYSTTAAQGFNIFNQVGCNHCHSGDSFSDFAFHNTGVAWNATAQTFTDNGREGITNLTSDLGAFRTPTLRNLSARAPYMHDGSAATLDEVVTFYNNGGVSNPHLDNAMHPLNLSSGQRAALVAFLETLDGEGFADVGPSAFPE